MIHVTLNALKQLMCKGMYKEFTSIFLISSTPTWLDPYHGISWSLAAWDVPGSTPKPRLPPANPCGYDLRNKKIHDMQERDTVDNRTVYLNQDLADLPLQELCVCSRPLDCSLSQRWVFGPNYGVLEDVTSWNASAFPAMTQCPVSVLWDGGVCGGRGVRAYCICHSPMAGTDMYPGNV